MNYQITRNNEHNSIEIMFDGKPSETIRDALKALRFRWHGQKKLWYGYTDEATARAAIDGTNKDTPAKEQPAAPAVNKYGVKIGDFFSASWGYEQTNVDWFQVIELVGKSSVRVREVNPPIVEETAVSGMSADRVYKLDRSVILPPSEHSVFINDQEHGDLKRLKSYREDQSCPQFFLKSFADAHYVAGDTHKCYESWYY